MVKIILSASLISLILSLFTFSLPQEEGNLRSGASSHVAPQEFTFASKLRSLGIRLHPGTKHRKDSRETQKTSSHCKSVVYRTLKSLPEKHASLVENLTLYYTKDGRRGLAGGSQVILRCLNVENYELAAVLTHEIGHLVDEHLKGNKSYGESGFFDFGTPLYNDDPSLRFYRLSFENDHEKKEDASKLDFVTGYAETDPFEDFAETYLFYRLHSPEFRSLAESNSILKAKYGFMKFEVFGGEEFDLNSTSSSLTTHRVYDATVVPFDVKKLGYLGSD